MVLARSACTGLHVLGAGSQHSVLFCARLHLSVCGWPERQIPSTIVNVACIFCVSAMRAGIPILYAQPARVSAKRNNTGAGPSTQVSTPLVIFDHLKICFPKRARVSAATQCKNPDKSVALYGGFVG